MNLKIGYILLFFVLILYSCGKKTVGRDDLQSYKEQDSSKIELDNIPIVTSDLGEFPFLITPPSGYELSGAIGEMNFDEIYHFYDDSSTLTVGGKFYETSILRVFDKKKKIQDNSYNDSLIFSFYDEKIKEIGGVETNLLKKYTHTLHSEADVDSIKRYLIRSNKGNIWIDLISLHEPKQINYSIIYEGKTSEPVNILKAERLRFALEQNGKVIVYVNFAEGKISLQPDGLKAVNEIRKLMFLDSDLRLSVEGHTDEIGTKEYSKRLSSERVRTIVKTLTDAGIKSYRFKLVAHGTEKMVADNMTIENRAKNRRIELVKINVDETDMRNAIAKDGKAVLQITFESGKSVLRPEGADIVDQIAKLLTTDAKLKLSIEGHTDNVGSAVSNKKLSLDRANSVINRLVELGIDRRRLRPSGYGMEKPIVPNNTSENREKNRRVEIVKIN